jgi:hypothetical protein
MGLEEIPLRGYLAVFVDGYKLKDKFAAHFLSNGDRTVSVPDRLVPAERHEVGSMRWWEDGWAVGDNSRDRLCSRLGSKPLKRFFDFDEAVRFVYLRQQRFKAHQHTLVYVTKDVHGKVNRTIVRSMDDVEAVHAEMDNNKIIFDSEIEKRRKRFPELERLETIFGWAKARRMAFFLSDIREKGATEVRASMPSSSWYRIKRELAGVGIEI